MGPLLGQPTRLRQLTAAKTVTHPADATRFTVDFTSVDNRHRRVLGRLTGNGNVDLSESAP